jgi:glycosyltransferase involved in cell wall biosynthesis
MPFLLLMPSYNQAHFIVDAVRSVLAQDDGDWELWIVDNSSDNTPEIMQQFSDLRIHFHHIAARMDPGSCLNWMLERAVGRDFSYVHTDNNLHPSYVRNMRAALAEDALALAYCDMRTIDERGRYLNVYRRGAFDLPRLLSVDSLGVPFSATTELARQVGGFSVRDFADDVKFCVGAYGLAKYVYVSEPLLDYRLHGMSRTEAAGGGLQMQRLFADLMPRIVTTLQQRGLHPQQVLEQAIRRGLDDLDLFMEDVWYRKLARRIAPWWRGYPRFEYFFLAGLIDVPGFSAKLGRPPKRLSIRDADGRWCVSVWTTFLLRLYLMSKKRELRYLTKKTSNLLLTWATVALEVSAKEVIAIRVCSVDFRTLWAARQLQVAFGWKPLLDSSIVNPPSWIRWGRASGHEPLLDCKVEISLTR